MGFFFCVVHQAKSAKKVDLLHVKIALVERNTSITNVRPVVPAFQIQSQVKLVVSNAIQVK